MIDMEAKKRPTLSDPAEFALVKSIYFPKDILSNDPIDEEERLDRQQRKNNINHAR